MGEGEGRTIGTALVTVEYTGRHWERIAEALRPARVIRAAPKDGAAIAAALEGGADVAILAGDADSLILEKGRQLRWIHCNHAGINNSARPEVFERGITLTSSAGRSGPVLAEHTFYLLLSLVYRSRLAERQQREHVWNNLYRDSRGLYEKTIGIVGLGNTGREIAARAKAFGMTVLGYGRSAAAVPANVDRYWAAERGDGVETLLRESDVVVLAARLTDRTWHLIDAAALSMMKKTALLVNISRGAVVDEAALALALRDGTIAGAASDVFETEPLPEGSPLWDLPNMVITPHCTPEMPDMPGNCVEIICENIKAYREGAERLRNQVDIRDVYTK
ncbi:MAG: D-2-hydroxyacid dehydrogenase [Clostridiales bacterium]|jgi:phosphoglycerate dehydrogenase-like enzyme|nr:D-2-hydroxyacid dehydrogenase [Clostridiales bacterium]